MTVDSKEQQSATDALRSKLAPTGDMGSEALANFVPKPSRAATCLARCSTARNEISDACSSTVSDGQNEASAHVRRFGPAVMPFESMQWAQRYRTENLQPGPKPKKTSDVVSVGDVVYVRVDKLPKAPNVSPEGEASTDKASGIAEPVEFFSLMQTPKAEGALISLEATGRH